MLTCSWKNTLGIDCPGCGFQRSFLKLLQGEVYESLILFPATIPLLILFIFLLLHLKYKFRHGASFIITLFSISSGIIVTHFLGHFL